MFGGVEYAVVMALCGDDCEVLPHNGEGVLLGLSAAAVGKLLLAGAESGCDAENGFWADKAVREVAMFAAGPDPWWKACELVAEAVSRIDTLADAALGGGVLFALSDLQHAVSGA